MPSLDVIMAHGITGPAIREGLQKGREERLQEGLQGEQKGELAIVRRQIGKRFCTVPTWTDQRLKKLSLSELEQLSDRMFDAKTIEELFDG